MRQEKILTKLIELTVNTTLKNLQDGFQGYSAQQMSSFLEIDRANCSRELNSLNKQGKIIKINGKPVHFFPKEKLEQLLFREVDLSEVDSLTSLIREQPDASSSEEVFENIIGYDGSLINSLSKAKAAMIYSPNGLHTLISGGTGTGKTMLAEYMFEYAKKARTLDQDAKQVIFNCAEYAENPQLLLSQLFGYEKGAFSGAESSRDGLVAQASGGVLFLDEVHRLPPEGQEMLFLLMDKGFYRRLGETTDFREIDVLIIAATSENITSSLLTTFVRRFSMTLNLPKLGERPIKERFELIAYFFSQEANRVQRTIILSKWSLASLLGYDCYGNVGQLKSDIKLISARAYLDAMVEEHQDLVVEKKILPAHIASGVINREKNVEIEKLLKYLGKKHLYFTPNQSENYSREMATEQEKDEDNIYKNIENRFLEITNHDLMSDTNNLKTKMNSYIYSLFSQTTSHIQNQQEIYKIVERETYQVIEQALKIAEKIVDRPFSKQTYISLSVHIQAAMNKVHQTSRLTPDLESVKEEYPSEFEAAEIVFLYLTNELSFQFQENEKIFITLFLTMDLKKNNYQKKISILLLAHGEGTATSIAGVVNKLLDTNHVRALDMPLEESVQDFFKKVENVVEEIDEGRGVLLIVDMGSLENFGELLMSKQNTKIRTLSFLSTPIALEATRKAMFNDNTLDNVYDDMLPFMPKHQFEAMNSKLINYPNLTTSNERPVILSSCYTGEGSAIQMIHYLKNVLPKYVSKLVEFIPVNKLTFDSKIMYERHILACVGSVDLELDNIPFISAEKILLGNGVFSLKEILRKEFSLVENDIPIIQKNGLEMIVESSLSVISPKLVINLLKNSFEKIAQQQIIANYNHTFITFIMHGANMIERVFLGHDFNYLGIEEKLMNEQELYKVIKKSLYPIEDKINIIIPDTEIGYIMDMFGTD